MNEERFSSRAETYAQYRPTYADGFMEYLYTEVGLNAGSVIADIGSGTGILADLLLRRGGTVYGVEPNDDMRRIAEDDLARHGSFVSVNATAEMTSLPEASVDFITVAQAFHWFDRQKFRAECRRLLRPGGKVILVWNRKGQQQSPRSEARRHSQGFLPPTIQAFPAVCAWCGWTRSAISSETEWLSSVCFKTTCSSTGSALSEIVFQAPMPRERGIAISRILQL